MLGYVDTLSAEGDRSRDCQRDRFTTTPGKYLIGNGSADPLSARTVVDIAKAMAH